MTTTTGYIREHGLTIEQKNAIDLLVTGQTDTEAAAAVGVHRVTVTKWRLYDPWFQAELNVRRRELWGGAGERLRALLPKALDIIESELTAGENRYDAALQIVKLTRLPESPPVIGPTQAEQIIDALTARKLATMQAERGKYQTTTESLLASLSPPDRTQCEAEEKAALQSVLDEIESQLSATSNG